MNDHASIINNLHPTFESQRLNAIYQQTDYRVRLEWGCYGARSAAARGDIVVVVDTLSFSSAVVTAANHGAIIYPSTDNEDQAEIASRVLAVKAVPRNDVPSRGRFSLSPETYLNIESDTCVVLVSPHGATCCRNAQNAENLFVGSLLNAEATGKAVSRLMNVSGLDVTLVASGETWHEPMEGVELRFAIEDFVAAGAILSCITHDKSPEAQVCEAASASVENYLDEIIWDSISGRELRNAGFQHDVTYSAQLNMYGTVVIMDNERLVDVRMKDEYTKIYSPPVSGGE